ncbi:MAG: hypothetical protein AB1716_18660 [Planctomycetota bacterium]
MADPVAALRRRRQFILVGVAALAALAVLGVVCMLLIAAGSRRDEELYATVLLGALYVSTALACLPAWRRPRLRVFGIAGVAIAAVTCAVALYWFWSRIPWPARRYWESAAILGTVAGLLCAYVCLTSLARPPRGWRWVRSAAQLCAALLGAWIAVIILRNLSEREGLPPLVILIILTACGTLCTVLLHWLGGLHRPDATTTPLLLALTCPRCRLTQELTAGRARCRECGLTLRIEIEEETCPKCGYVLYRLTSDRCPECGCATESLEKEECQMGP